ncbi:unnamed protein product [Clonostachys rosea f. rosea IK726]|uniref:Uncharacterized protein n=2 Tax=Bionectria ochroleuca TaxID=29856 RepID=A0A0B7JLS9_BIOOC|nr:unnamed protein product [Clonostachys rosea f. rosea IK726]
MSTQKPQQGSPPLTPAFTPAMRDLQARGKNPFQGHPGHEDHHSVMHLGLGQCLPKDTYEARERRAYAMSVLDSPEKLMMYAQSENDSIPSQRLRFMQMAAGLSPERMNPGLNMPPEIGSKSNPSTPLKGPELGQRIVSGSGGFTIAGPSSG